MIRRTALVFSLWTAASVLVLSSCDNTPTVPVPPPEVIAVSSPTDGFSQVLIDPGEAVQGDIVLVFNENSGYGVMERIENPDGSLEVEIEAEVGDKLYIQIKHDNRLSIEEQHPVPVDTDSGGDSDAGADSGSAQ